MRLLLSLAVTALSTVAIAADTAVTPGQWEVTSIVESVEMPGAPAGMLDMMKGKPRVMSICITAADAQNGPQALLKESGENCKSVSYSAQGDRLTSVMKCSQGGGEMTVSMTGTFSANSYTVKSEMVMTGEAQGMKMTATATGKFLGPCK